MSMLRITISAFVLLSFLGCSAIGQQKTAEYKLHAGKVNPLEVPAGLAVPTVDGRFAIPAKPDSVSESTDEVSALPPTSSAKK